LADLTPENVEAGGAAGWVGWITRRLRRLQFSTTFETRPKAPAGDFCRSQPVHFYSARLMHFYSGVDIRTCLIFFYEMFFI